MQTCGIFTLMLSLFLADYNVLGLQTFRSLIYQNYISQDLEYTTLPVHSNHLAPLAGDRLGRKSKPNCLNASALTDTKWQLCGDSRL